MNEIFTRKIAFIKVVQDYTGCSLSEAQTLVDGFTAQCEAVKKSDSAYLERIRRVIANPQPSRYLNMVTIANIIKDWEAVNPF
jgi:hypothetical protein